MAEKRIYFILSAAGQRRQRRNREPITLYISKVSFANSDGMAVSKIWHTDQKEKAFKFSKFAAEGIANSLRGPSWKLQEVKIEPVTIEQE